jgi:hypothetical protein
VNNYEKFVKWYLRFNGYFNIEGFVVHAADDPGRISNGMVGSYTETDTLAVRMPYSAEVAGDLLIANHELLVKGQEERVDMIIAEAKSGKQNKPNSVWREGDVEVIKYIIRFFGFYKKPCTIKKVSTQLASEYSYQDEESRIRYIVFAKKRNEYYQQKGLTYILYQEMIDFLVDIRGQSWLKSKIGIASVHYQWDPLIKLMFEAANDFSETEDQRAR